jgi:hypothetical protein
MQSASLSPFLHALAPDHFAVVHPRACRALRAITGVRHSPRLEHYPENNQAILDWLDHHGDPVESATHTGTDTDTAATDVLEAFAPWVSSHEKATEPSGPRPRAA